MSLIEGHYDANPHEGQLLNFIGKIMVNIEGITQCENNGVLSR